jgi:2-iminobutanoate/2-iminopropanoate deaminase
MAMMLHGEILETDRLMKPIAGFSHAVRVGDTVFTSALAGVDAETRFPGRTPGLADMEAQTELLLENVSTALSELAAGLGDVARVKGYIAEWRMGQTWNDVYRRHFAAPYPSRATVASPSFAIPQILIELEATAVVGGGAEEVRSERLPPALAPYSQAGTRAGDWFFTAVIPADADANVPAGNAARQSELALANLLGALEAAGATVDDLVKVGVTLADARHADVFEEAYRRAIPAPRPARAVTASRLGLPELLVELEAVAFLGEKQRLAPAPGDGAAGGVLASGFLYTSAFVGRNRRGEPLHGMEAQTEQALTEAAGVLAEAGLGADHVVKTTVTLTDWRLYADYNAAYDRRFSAPFPARGTVEAGLLHPGLHVAIECIAAVDAERAVVLTA